MTIPILAALMLIPQAGQLVNDILDEALESPEPVVEAEPSQSPTPEPVAAPEPTPEPVASPYKPVLRCIRKYESTNDYTAVNPSGKYRNAYQMDRDFWLTYGGDPSYTGRHEHAPPRMQDRVAVRGLKARGLGPWPTPEKRCGHLLP